MFVGVGVRACDIEFVVFTDCESCTRPISTNSGYMEAGEYWLTRGTCFRTSSRGGRGHRAAVDFVVCSGCGGIQFSSFFFSCFFHRTHPACCKYDAALPHLLL